MRLLDLVNLPKAELHLHIEGTLEPEMMFALASRHGIQLPWNCVSEARDAFRFGTLQSFLDLYYAGMVVLRTAEDFRDLALAYLRRANAEGVVHAELFFDPQAHRAKGISFLTIARALKEAADVIEAETGMTSLLIPCVLRHLDEADGMRMLDEVLEHPELVVGVGLDSSEVGHPPSKFTRLFRRVRDAGLNVVAHAGEEGPPDYIRQAIDELGATRIDHGVRILEDADLTQKVARAGIPLTVCPVSNWRLGGCATLADHPLPRMLDAGLNVTIHSDDPSYLQAYILGNYEAVRNSMGVADAQLATLAKASIDASFACPKDRLKHENAWMRFMDKGKSRP